MKILSVIPILKGVAPDALSYYTGLPVHVGSLVEIPVRKRFAPALVVGVSDAKENTTNIRTAAYKLKKVRRVISAAALPEPVIRTAEILAQYYVAPLGAVLHGVLPQHI